LLEAEERFKTEHAEEIDAYQKYQDELAAKAS
jgi:hypothetical protein